MRVVVVGAGIAGLVSALRLAGHGCEVTVLDAAARVGGKLALAPGRCRGSPGWTWARSRCSPGARRRWR